MVELADRAIANLTAPHAPHTNCARCFMRLVDENFDGAQEISHAAQQFLDSLH